MLQEFLIERNIEHLMHFTRAKNLNNILKYGLLPIQKLSALGIETTINDKSRLDNCTSASCLSIEFPNYKMFYKLRMENENENWVIISLTSRVLLDKKCAFCYDNASNEEIINIPMENKCTVEMLKKMFSDIDGHTTRNERKLKRYYTTLPQAEVLIFDTIELEYFESIIFKNKETMDEFRNKFDNKIKSELIPDYFYAREDYEFDL